MAIATEATNADGEATQENGAVVTDTASLPADAISYSDLYARWERGNWSATELDFTEDARQWREEMTEMERTAAVWNYAQFFWGEDSVADNLSPYIDAAPLPEQRYFLATQQADEARHAIFFKRFMEEVCGLGQGSVASGLEAIRPQLTPGIRTIFKRLDRMADELRADRSRPQLAAGVALYHFVVEAALAHPGQHMIADFLERRQILPAFSEGMRNVALDEQRHIAFGVKLMADLAREDSRVPAAVARLLHEVLQHTGQVLMPPGWDERYVSALGSTFDQIGGIGVSSLAARLRAAGLAPETLPGPPIMFAGMTPEEIARRGRELAMAGITGVRQGPTRRDPETVALLFNTMALTINPTHGLKRPASFQYEFVDPDIATWHLTVDGAAATVAEGPVPAPAVRMAISYQDYVDIIGRRLDPRRALVTGRLRLRGNPLGLRKLVRVFPQP